MQKRSDLKAGSCTAEGLRRQEPSSSVIFSWDNSQDCSGFIPPLSPFLPGEKSIILPPVGWTKHPCRGVLLWEPAVLPLLTCSCSAAACVLVQNLWPLIKRHDPLLFFTLHCLQSSSKAAVLTKTPVCSCGLAEVNAVLCDCVLAARISEHDTALASSTSLTP